MELANDTEYGLAAGVYSSDVEHGRSIADQIDAGMVPSTTTRQDEPNAPFGGMTTPASAGTTASGAWTN